MCNSKSQRLSIISAKKPNQGTFSPRESNKHQSLLTEEITHQIRIICCLLDEHLNKITSRDLLLLFLLFLTRRIYALQLLFNG